MEALIKAFESDEVIELNAQESNDISDLQNYIINQTEYDLDDFRMSRTDGIIEVWLA